MKPFLEDMCFMKSIKGSIFLLLFLFSFSLQAQKSKPLDDSPELDKVKNMVGFLEYMLNTLGSEKTSARDKEVLVTESYKKIFRDDKVQIEDDLDTKRKVITNKDVPAYLKDVDFFFKDVKFEFTIEDISVGEQANRNTFYKVTLLRNLHGTAVDGEVINNTMKRFIEINYNPEDRDLKIVSIYTNEFDQRAALTYWWNQLSYEWQSIFKKTLNIVDSVQLADIKRITGIAALDLSDDPFIQDIGALSQLYDLRSLNISKTNISDLSPIRNLTELTDLNISHTPTIDLTPLRYARKLSHLSLAHTSVIDLSIIENMPDLLELDLSGTELISYEPLRNMVQLQRLNLESSSISNLQPLDSLLSLTELNVSHTAAINLNPIAGLINLQVIALDSNRVADINALKHLENLSELYINHTLVSDLSALQGLGQLKRIYCDHSAVNRATAEAFMTAHPEVLVIFDSEDLKSWWDDLSSNWQKVFQKTLGIGANTTKEELARIVKLDSINLNNTGITDLEPLQRLYRMKTVIASNIGISDLLPLQKLTDLIYLDINYTSVSDLSAIVGLKELKELRANHTLIKSLPSGWSAPTLKWVYLDNTGVDDEIVRAFLTDNPYCFVVYKTERLNNWWRDLPRDWKEIFRVYVGNDKQISTEALHQLIEGDRLYFEDKPVNDLNILNEFIRLKEIRFSDTAIADLTPLSLHSNLQLLQASKSPIKNIEVLSQLPRLEDLDLSDTPIENLKVLSSMLQLKRLDCSGTRIRKLNELETLSGLQYLDCSNTAVRNLDPVSTISLGKLVCYNTRVSLKRVKAFEERHPECEVVYY